MNSIIDISNEDWNKLLKENNINYEDLKKILNSEEFKLAAGDIVDLKSDIYFKDKSDIHGQGIFARENIKRGDTIGIVLGFKDKVKYRSYLGRFTNHSSLKNTVFKELEFGEAIAICVKEINVGEEILVDYRDHWGKW